MCFGVVVFLEVDELSLVDLLAYLLHSCLNLFRMCTA